MPIPALGTSATAFCGGLAALAAPKLCEKIQSLVFSRKSAEDEEDLEPWGGAARIPEDEDLRLDYLRKLQLLDTDEHETKFDDITRVVANLLGVPIVLISLVADDRQWFKSRVGLDANTTGRDVSFCAWTLIPQTPRMLIVPDARLDKRFAKNPLVVGNPFICFYGGCPLVTSQGIRLGAFCLIDHVPRVISPAQQQLVINFAELITRQLEKDSLAQQQAKDEAVFRTSTPRCPPTYRDFEGGKLRADRMFESLSEPLLLVSMNPEDPFWPILFANEEWYELTKFARSSEKTGRGSSSSFQMPVHKHFLQYLKPLNVAGSASLPELFGSFIRAGVCFGLTCETISNEKIQFTCRCQPADKPLDAAAEAIQVVRDPEAGGGGPEAEDPIVNRLYFVIMSPVACQPPHSAVDASPRLSPVSSNAIQAESDSSVDENNVFSSSQHTSDTDTPGSTPNLHQPSTRQGKTMESLSHIRPAQTPFSDVRLVRMIGRGSFAQVFYGLWIGQPVAVKIARWTKTTPGEARPIFEGALSVELSHPNLVQTFKHSSVLVCKASQEMEPNFDMPMPSPMQGSSSVSTAEALSAGIGDQFETWITQEWCDMGPLKSHVDARPPMQNGGLLEVIGICVDISSAMTYMHGRGIIHGDLTANNVLLTCKPICKKGYICKVSDFGLSRILEGDSESILTQQLGTVTYMPPELFKTDGCKLTPKADVYAIGIMMWHVYVGSAPYKNLTPPQVIVQVAQGLGITLPENCDPMYAQLFKQCTERDPERRPIMQVVNDTLLQYLSMDMFKESDGPQQNGQAEKVEKPEKVSAKTVSPPRQLESQRQPATQIAGQPAG